MKKLVTLKMGIPTRATKLEEWAKFVSKCMTRVRDIILRLAGKAAGEDADEDAAAAAMGSASPAHIANLLRVINVLLLNIALSKKKARAGTGYPIYMQVYDEGKNIPSNTIQMKFARDRPLGELRTAVAKRLRWPANQIRIKSYDVDAYAASSDSLSFQDVIGTRGVQIVKLTAPTDDTKDYVAPKRERRDADPDMQFVLRVLRYDVGLCD